MGSRGSPRRLRRYFRRPRCNSALCIRCATVSSMSRGKSAAPWRLTCGQAGQAAEGLTLVADALTHTAAQEEYWCEAELHRLKSDLLVQQAEGLGSSLLRDAETCLRQALTV